MKPKFKIGDIININGTETKLTIKTATVYEGLEGPVVFYSLNDTNGYFPESQLSPYEFPIFDTLQALYRAAEEYAGGVKRTLPDDILSSMSFREGIDWAERFDCFIAGASWAKQNDPDVLALIEAIKKEMSWRKIKYCTKDGLDNLGVALARWESKDGEE